MSGYTSIGKTKKPHGLKGEVKCFVEDKYLEEFIQAKIFFLMIDKAPVPYFVESVREGSHLIIKLEDIDTPEKATQISNKEICIPSTDIIPDDEKELIEDLAFGYLNGFLIVDSELGSIGSIEDVLEFPQQEMALLTINNKEIFIPLNEHLIQSIDEGNKKVHMTLPEGLLDI